MDPVTIGLLAGAGLGLVKGGQDQQREKRQRQQEAQIAAYSPWTGMQAQRVQEADPLGSLMQGGFQGAMLGKNLGGSAGAAGAAEAAPPGYTQQPIYPTTQPPMQGQYPWMNMQR